MKKVLSKDGTEIAYETKGSGPGLIFVDGALGYRGLKFNEQLEDLLAPNFTVYRYDRRGRGESTNSKPFAVQREVEDIDALIQAAGGSAYVYGISSGACLAVEAAAQLGGKIKKLALYEAPYNSDPTSRQAWWDYRGHLKELILSNKPGEAVILFMQFVGTPEEMIKGMQQSPVWPLLVSVAPTLEYDAAAIGDDRTVPTDRAAKVQAATLVMDGGANLVIMPFMHASAVTLAQSISHSEHRTLEGQTHAVEAGALAPILVDFFSKQE